VLTLNQGGALGRLGEKFDTAALRALQDSSGLHSRSVANRRCPFGLERLIVDGGRTVHSSAPHKLSALRYVYACWGADNSRPRPKLSALRYVYAY
jgi:hypothetical protein